MKVLIVYAHPNPSSFNGAILKVVGEGLRAGGHEIKVKDLYAEDFNPLLGTEDLTALNQGALPADIQCEQQALLWAQGLVFIYPLWWFDRPAILKGWFDRVFTHGFAFRYTEKGMEGLLHHSKALVVVTTGGSIEEFERIGAKEHLVRPTTDGTLALCGVRNIVDKVLYSIPVVSAAARQKLLAEVHRLALEF
jgi:NAD(P)H dehydrogenase (quinone)